MDQFRESEFPPDLSPLAWVQEELRRSLESVHKALRRMLRDGDSKFSVLGAEVGWRKKKCGSNSGGGAGLFLGEALSELRKFGSAGYCFAGGEASLR